MQKHLLLASITLLPLLLLANPNESKDENINNLIKTGNEASKHLLKTLGSNLKKNMKAGGPIQAFNFCNTQAYPLTDSVNEKLASGVSVKRISLQYRNPANAPQEDEKEILVALGKLQNSGAILPPYIIQQTSKNSYKYYKPLSINKGVCLKCHGDVSQNKKLTALIEKNYPEDKATGYKMHDLRGAIVVTIKK